MKKEYISPRAEKLEFDFTKVVTASYGGKGDKGWGHGCQGAPNPGERGNPRVCRGR